MYFRDNIFLIRSLKRFSSESATRATLLLILENKGVFGSTSISVLLP